MLKDIQRLAIVAIKGGFDHSHHILAIDVKQRMLFVDLQELAVGFFIQLMVVQVESYLCLQYRMHLKVLRMFDGHLAKEFVDLLGFQWFTMGLQGGYA